MLRARSAVFHRCVITLIAASAAWIAACGDGTTIAAGDGLSLQVLSDRTELAVDTARVPVAPCAAGETPERVAGGWSCGALDVAAIEARLANLEALAAGVGAIETRIAGVEARIDAVANSLPMIDALSRALEVRAAAITAARAVAPLSIPSAACAVSGTIVDRRVDRVKSGVARCPISRTAPWNAATRAVHDPDGLALASRVSGRASYTPDAPQNAIAPIDTNLSIATATGARTNSIYAPSFDATKYAYEEITIEGGAAFFGTRFENRSTIAPPELEVPGGAIYVNAGNLAELVDASGRFWENDELFLAPGHESTPTATEVVTIDQSLLMPAGVPNDMLRSERWCHCDLRYTIVVPNAHYHVTAYFSENCVNCASRTIGGTSQQNEPLHQFTIVVEDQRVESYAPGATAGSVFRATQLDFDVTVVDGLLEITSVDIGENFPDPGDSMMKGFIVRRMP